MQDAPTARPKSARMPRFFSAMLDVLRPPPRLRSCLPPLEGHDGPSAEGCVGILRNHWISARRFCVRSSGDVGPPGRWNCLLLPVTFAAGTGGEAGPITTHRHNLAGKA